MVIKWVSMYLVLKQCLAHSLVFAHNYPLSLMWWKKSEQRQGARSSIPQGISQYTKNLICLVGHCVRIQPGFTVNICCVNEYESILTDWLLKESRFYCGHRMLTPFGPWLFQCQRKIPTPVTCYLKLISSIQEKKQIISVTGGIAKQIVSNLLEGYQKSFTF